MKELNQKGQALLFVIVGLTVALSLAVNVSVRTIASLSRSSRLDTSSRALAAAEAGIERVLTVSSYSLTDSINNNRCPIGSVCTSETCPDELTNTGAVSCYFTLGSDQDNIRSQAILNISAYKPTEYFFTLKSGEFREINLKSYTDTDVTVCWKSPTIDANYGDLFYVLYGGVDASDISIFDKKGLDLEGEHVTGYEVSGFESVPNTNGRADFLGCRTIAVTPTAMPIGLRLRAVGGDVSVGVYSDEELPLQGFLLKSYGRVMQDESVVASRSIDALYTLPYSAASFDFSVYAGQ